eukprot:g2018.t1
MYASSKGSNFFLRNFRKIDLYPKVDTDATHATACGFVLTVLGIVISLYLFVGQWNEYRNPSQYAEIYVLGSNRTMADDGGDLFIDFNVTFQKMPCNYLTVDYFDVFGKRNLDIADHIKLNAANNGQRAKAGAAITGSGRKLLHTTTSSGKSTHSEFKGGSRHLMSVGDDESSEEKTTDEKKAKDPKDPFDLIPDDVKTIDLDAVPQFETKPSDLHPGAIVIKVGDNDRHIIPGAGEHQIIAEDHPVHAEKEGGSTLLTSSTFNEFVSDYDIVLVNFFAPWCPWCQKYAPIWEAASKTLTASDWEGAKKARFAKVDCTVPENSVLCKDHQVRGFPTVKVYRAGSTMTHKSYTGDRTVSALLDYVKKLPKRADPLTQFGPEIVTTQATEHCVAWRQTKNCDPNGVREAANDKGCSQVVSPGNSGYCECKDGIHASPVKCEHRSFDCQTECRKRLEQLSRQKPTAKKDAQLEAKMRLGGENLVGMDPMSRHVQKAMAAKKFAAMHEDDMKLREPERQHLELGCTVEGTFKVGLTPGTLVFTAYSPWHSFEKEAVDMSHDVDTFVFGRHEYSQQRTRTAARTKLEGIGLRLNDLGGRTFSMGATGHRYAHEHFLRLMQTDVDKDVLPIFPQSRYAAALLRNPFVRTFQYAANSHEYEIDDTEGELPSVRFAWDMDPIAIEISAKQRSLYSFLTSVLAIIGGTFTAFALLDGGFHSFWKRALAGRNKRVT